MKLILIATLSSICGLAASQSADYRLVSNGKQIGTLHDVEAHGPKGISETTIAHVDMNGKPAILTTNDLDSPQGDWLMKSMSIGVAGRTVSVSAQPSRSGAHVTITANGKPAGSREIPRATKEGTRDVSTAWFRSRRPKIGETASFQRFDPQQLVWKHVSIRYVGPKTVNIAGKNHQGFEIAHTEDGKQSQVIVDSSSMLILLVSPSIRIERVYH